MRNRPMMNIHVCNVYQELIACEEDKLKVNKVLIDLQIENSSLE